MTSLRTVCCYLILLIVIILEGSSISSYPAEQAINIGSLKIILPSDCNSKQLFLPSVIRVPENYNTCRFDVLNKRDMWYRLRFYKGVTEIETKPIYLPPYKSTCSFDILLRQGDEIKIRVANELQDNRLAVLWGLDLFVRAFLGTELVSADFPVELIDTFSSKIFYGPCGSLGFHFAARDPSAAIKDLASCVLKNEAVRNLLVKLLQSAGIQVTEGALVNLAPGLQLAPLARFPLWKDLWHNANQSPFLEEATFKVEQGKIDIISKIISFGPYPAGQKYYLRVSNVDDISKVKINGREILNVGYHNERELDMTGYLLEGNNSIELTLENTNAGWTYGYTLRQGNNLIWNESCGGVGVEGCRNNDQTRGIVARHLINLSLVSPSVHTCPGGEEYNQPPHPQNVFTQGYRGYCTWYVADRWLHAGNSNLPSTGNAIRWLEDAKTKFLTGSTPERGSIVVFGSTDRNPAGHVAYVESVSGNQFTIAQMNVGGNIDRNIKTDCFDKVTRDTLQINQSSYKGMRVLGFIYPQPVSQPPISKPITPIPSPTPSITPQVAKPEIISNLRILETPPYKVGQIITAEFSIRNSGSSPTTFDALTVGGRLNGQCPNNRCPDFEFKQNITLSPNVSYAYRGTLKIEAAGNYHFFTAYRTKDGQWNTSIPTTAGVKNTLDIYAAPSPVVTIPSQPTAPTQTVQPYVTPSALARIDMVDITPKSVQVGQSVTLRMRFNNTGNSTNTFIAGASLWRPSDYSNPFANFERAVTLSSGQGAEVTWSYQPNLAGNWGYQFTVWKQKPFVYSNLLVKQPSPISFFSVTAPIVQASAPSPTPTPPPAPCTDGLSFVGDVSVPDGAQMQPAQRFTKTWRLRNTGSCSWGNGYILAFISGLQMGAPSYASVASTPPDGMADISVPMVTPASPGTYQGFWQMRNLKNQAFGPQIWVKISVISAPTPTPATPAPIPRPVPPALPVDKSPNVTSFSASASQINQGQSITLYYNVMDDVGLKQVELWRADDSAGVSFREIKRVSVSGKQYFGSFSDTPPSPGTYRYGLHVADTSGKWNCEKNSQTGSSPGVYGPKQVSVIKTSTSTPSPPAPTSTPAPQVVSARIDGYSPGDTNNPIRINVGGSAFLSVRFTNTGNTAWRFIAGTSVWDSSGKIVGNYSTPLSSPLQPGQQTSVSWNHQVKNAGDYWVQFGVWKQTPFAGENLLERKPIPAQRLISVGMK